jgi:hypothetical protein
MNAKDLRPIHRALLPTLPGFAAHKSLLLMAPMNGMLRAIHCDPSAFSKDDFHVEAFVMPLCVPTDYLVLTLGHPIRHPKGGWGWTRKMPDLVSDLSEAIQTQVLPFLQSIRTAEDFARMATEFWANPHTARDVAFALANAGDIRRAIAVLDEALPGLESLDKDIAWHLELCEDAKMMRDLLASNPVVARRQLVEWEDYTIRALRLEQFR